MLSTDAWFKPYENFGPNDIAGNIEEGKDLENARIIDPFGFMPGRDKLLSFSSEADRERYYRYSIIPKFEREGFHILFVEGYVDEQNYGYTEDRLHRVYYPVREPAQKELVYEEENRRVIVENFGRLFASLDVYNPEGLVEEFELFFRTSSAIFYSSGRPYDIPKGLEEKIRSKGIDLESGLERGSASRIITDYDLWKPNDASLPQGVIYVPLDLPTLKSLEFKISRRM